MIKLWYIHETEYYIDITKNFNNKKTLTIQCGIINGKGIQNYIQYDPSWFKKLYMVIYNYI